MLESLDQIAFTILLALSNWIGTPDIPKASDPDWQVVQAWEEKADKTYEMVIESKTIGKYCAANPNHFVLFPQTYMGQHEIFVDYRLVYTNSISDKWELISMFSATGLNCRLIEGAGAVRLKLNSYIKYFSVLPYFPTKGPSLSSSYYITKYIYVFAASVCFFLTIIGLTIIYKILPKDTIFSFVVEDMFFLVMALSASNDILGGINMKYSHTGIALGLWGGIIFFMSSLAQEKFMKYKYGLLLLLLIVSFLSFDKRNLVQCLIYIPIIPATIVLCLIISKIMISFQYTVKEKVAAVLILALGVITTYFSVRLRGGAMSMGLFIISTSMLKFSKILKEVSSLVQQKRDIMISFHAERLLSSQLYEQQEKYREILHDIKAPISTLSMIANNQNGYIREILLKIIGQFKFVLSKIEGDAKAEFVDWYSVSSVVKKITNVTNDYSSLYKNINFALNYREDHLTGEIACNLPELTTSMMELVNNSIKHSVNLNSISLTFYFETVKESFCIHYSDDGVGISPEQIRFLGDRGYARGTSGTGLNSMKKKIEKWGGAILFDGNRKGFSCRIILKVRK